MMFDHFFLNIYLCGAGGQTPERIAIEAALSALRCDGNRFRACSPSPGDTSTNRFGAIDAADAVIVLCGTLNGKVTDDAVSLALQELHHAVKRDKTIAAFQLGSAGADPDMQQLIAEIDQHCFCASGPIRSLPELEASIVRVMMSAFSPCFRLVNGHSESDHLGGDISHADTAIAENPASDTLWHAAARAYAAVQGVDDARSMDFWKRYTGRFGENGDGWAQLGFLYLRMYGNNNSFHEQALHALCTAVERGFIDDGLIYDRIGHLYMDKRVPAEAENYFRPAAEKTPSRFGSCYGTCLMALKKYDQARSFIRDAAEKYQRDARSYFQAGVCLSELGDPDAAMEAYRKTIDLDPAFANAWFNLGGLYWNNNRIDDARKTWAVCLERFPENPMCEPARYFLSNI